MSRSLIKQFAGIFTILASLIIVEFLPAHCTCLLQLESIFGR